MEQFDDCFGELCAGRPGFVHARAGQDIRAAGAFADARVSVADEEWLTVRSGFLSATLRPTDVACRP